MKITKEQLRQIIIEELKDVVESDEHRGNPNKPWDALFPPGAKEKPPGDEEIQAALAGEERPITWDTIDEINRRIDALELKVYKGIDR